MTTTAHRRILRDVLAWTQLQARILTANGRANAYFTDFKPEELPHHHLRRGTEPILTKTAPAWAVGCWARPLFSGGGAATADDRVRNVQGLAHFVDVRMPAGRDVALLGVLRAVTPANTDGLWRRRRQRRWRQPEGGRRWCGVSAVRVAALPRMPLKYARAYVRTCCVRACACA